MKRKAARQLQNEALSSHPAQLKRPKLTDQLTAAEVGAKASATEQLLPVAMLTLRSSRRVDHKILVASVDAISTLQRCEAAADEASAAAMVAGAAATTATATKQPARREPQSREAAAQGDLDDFMCTVGQLKLDVQPLELKKLS